MTKKEALARITEMYSLARKVCGWVEEAADANGNVKRAYSARQGQEEFSTYFLGIIVAYPSRVRRMSNEEVQDVLNRGQALLEKLNRIHDEELALIK